MQSHSPRTVVVLGTGGTIAGRSASANDDLGYVSGAFGIDTLLSGIAVDDGIRVESEQVAQLDSKDMDVGTWSRLAGRVAFHAVRNEIAGIVVTHGTDTLEETAYLLSRVVRTDKAVVLTGAMRPATSREADGPANLGQAVAVAASGDMAGVAVAFAGFLHAADAVRKLHPTRDQAFGSGEAGPLGRIADGRLERLRDATVEAPLAIALPEDPSQWPWVEIVTSDAGADGRAVTALVGAGVEGIVVAATGNGSVHRGLETALAAAAAARIPVWRSTRCLDGAIRDGAPPRWPSAGALTPVKARIELMLRMLAARQGVATPD